MKLTIFAAMENEKMNLIDTNVKDNKLTQSWRNDPITEKQARLIQEMNEFAEFPLPLFTGITKGEACDYINQNMGRAHEHFDPKWKEKR